MVCANAEIGSGPPDAVLVSIHGSAILSLRDSSIRAVSQPSPDINAVLMYWIESKARIAAVAFAFQIELDELESLPQAIVDALDTQEAQRWSTWRDEVKLDLMAPANPDQARTCRVSIRLGQAPVTGECVEYAVEAPCSDDALREFLRALHDTLAPYGR